MGLLTLGFNPARFQTKPPACYRGPLAVTPTGLTPAGNNELQTFPAVTEQTRVVAANALVAADGNRYSVPPEHVGTEVVVRRRLGDPTLEVVSAAGRVIASHQTAPRGRGRVIRLPEHTAALENVVLASFTSDRPCSSKQNQPPSQAALRIAAEITGGARGSGPVIDLSVYQRHIDRLNGNDGA